MREKGTLVCWATAELLGAIRLPNTAFRDSAGTDVTSDIIFLQKRERKIVTEPDWVHLGRTEDGIAVNSYFAQHPEMMLGTMEYDTRMFGNGSKYTSCINHDENFDLKSALETAVGQLSGRITDVSDAEYDSSSKTVSYTVTVTVQGEVSGLYAGMTGDVTFVTKEMKQVCYVSNRAVFREGTRSYVKVQDDKGNVVKQEVTTGFSDGINVEITAGLSEGDTVLIESKVGET